MRLPRPRFTVRRLMMAVAIVGIMLGAVSWLRGRHEAFRRRAVELRYAEQAFRHPSYRDEVQDLEAADRLGRWAEKYERAARYPWLPVAPDSPEPR